MLSKTIIENILIVIGESFWVFSIYAQMRRLIKTRNTKGLSAPTLTLNTAGCVAWATYFASRHLWFPFTTNLLMVGMGTITLSYLLGDKKQFWRGISSIITLGPLTGYLLLVFPAAGGWVGVAYNTIATTPWVVRIVTTRKVSGISERALFFSLGAILCTLTYASLIHSAPLQVGCVLALADGLIIRWFYYRHRHHD